MALTAMNTQPVQTQQVQGGPPTQMAPQRPSAAMLLKKKKKPVPEPVKGKGQPPARPSAAMLMGRPK